MGEAKRRGTRAKRVAQAKSLKTKIKRWGSDARIASNVPYDVMRKIIYGVRKGRL